MKFTCVDAVRRAERRGELPHNTNMLCESQAKTICVLVLMFREVSAVICRAVMCIRARAMMALSASMYKSKTNTVLEITQSRISIWCLRRRLARLVLYAPRLCLTHTIVQTARVGATRI